MPVLLLDLDDTLGDRQAAFLRWAQDWCAQWAPNEPGAVGYLVEHDADGRRPRPEFFGLLVKRFAVQASVDALVAEYRTALQAALPPIGDDIKTRLRDCVAVAGRSPSSPTAMPTRRRRRSSVLSCRRCSMRAVSPAHSVFANPTRASFRSPLSGAATRSPVHG